MPVHLEPRCLEKLAELLRASSTVRISFETLWQIFAAAFPHRPSGPPERAMLRDALLALERRGVVRLPSVRGPRWDRAMEPALPRSVDLVRAPVSPRSREWRRFPWHLRLQWIADLKTVTEEQLAFLDRVHEGLVAGRFVRRVPFKYRSLQLTGDEKRLAALRRTTLFAPGRLDLDLLGCLPDHVPMGWEPVARTGDSFLIFENAGPFTVARQVLDSMDEPPYAMVGYGSGKTVTAALPHLQTIHRVVGSIDYVGDLDSYGLEIALAAQASAHSLGLPPLRPAPGLHRAMLHAAVAFGHPNGWPTATSRGSEYRVDDLVRFLPADVRNEAASVLRRGHRIPEEVLGPDELRAAFEIGASQV